MMRQYNNKQLDTIQGASASHGEIVSSQFSPPECQKDEIMIQVKVKAICDHGFYGIKKGDWINEETYKLIKTDIRKHGYIDVFYSKKALFDGDRIVWKKGGK